MGKNISVEVQQIRTTAKNIQQYKEEIEAERIVLSNIISSLVQDAWIGKNAQHFFDRYTEFDTNLNTVISTAVSPLVDGLYKSADVIEQLQSQTTNRIKTLGGNINGSASLNPSNVNNGTFRGIATSAAAAQNNQYVDSSKLHEDIFNDPNVKFKSMTNKEYSDVYAVERDGTIIGYTNKDNVNTNVEALDVDISQSVWDQAKADYQAHSESNNSTVDGAPIESITSDYNSDKPWHETEQFKKMSETFVSDEGRQTPQYERYSSGAYEQVINQQPVQDVAPNVDIPQTVDTPSQTILQPQGAFERMTGVIPQPDTSFANLNTNNSTANLADFTVQDIL